MPTIFTVKYPKKPAKEEHTKDVALVDLAHSARRKQRVYCLAHVNKLVMTYHEDRKLWHCENCGYIIQEGYGQSLMKKRKEDTKYRIINDPYALENITRDGASHIPAAFPVTRANERKLQEIEDPYSKDSIEYKSATEASTDINEEWY